MLKRFMTDEGGATAIEYGLLGGIIALGLVLSLGNIRSAFAGVVDVLVAAFAAA